MDREHPIPQEVSTYEFRLVGDMTIKQFMQVAAGALISLVLYSSNLAPYVKWPLIIISFLSGIALAFFPIEDRPLSKWIVLFVKAIYSPTVYVWNKNARKYDFFQPENVNVNLPPLPPVPATGVLPPTTLNPTPTTNQSLDEPTKLDREEENLLTKVAQEFNNPVSAAPIEQNINNIPALTASVARENIKIPVPANKSIPVEKQARPTEPVLPPEMTSTGANTSGVTPLAGQDLSSAKTATFSEDASPPSPPTRPNVVVGQVLDPNGKIIDGAILEIKDKEGRSVRALRSNRLGHFMIVTPLANGSYTITVEKDGHNFEPVSFEAKDQIIPSIAIWAKA
jgi:hypothetical protein